MRRLGHRIGMTVKEILRLPADTVDQLLEVHETLSASRKEGDQDGDVED